MGGRHDDPRLQAPRGSVAKISSTHERASKFFSQTFDERLQVASFPGRVILWAVRWYCRYGISYRDPEQMMGERGVSVDHSTIYRWVQKYAPEMERRVGVLTKRVSKSGAMDLPLPGRRQIRQHEPGADAGRTPGPTSRRSRSPDQNSAASRRVKSASALARMTALLVISKASDRRADEGQRRIPPSSSP